MRAGLFGRVVKIFIALVLAVAVTAICGYLIYNMSGNDFLTTTLRLLIQVLCVVGIAASVLLLRTYIQSLTDSGRDESKDSEQSE
ncbi:MAG: hypothetical protein RR244_02275 [Oscillospiraceae bacterium]